MVEKLFRETRKQTQFINKYYKYYINIWLIIINMSIITHVMLLYFKFWS